MKKTIYLLSFLILSFFVLATGVSAASFDLNKNADNIKIGDTVNITATMSNATDDQYADFFVEYDTERFDFISSPEYNCGRTLKCQIEGNGSVTLSFKAKSEGIASFIFQGAVIDNSSVVINESIKVNVGSSNYIEDNNDSVIEDKLNADNYLKSLKIDGYKISPKFNKDTLEYSVTLPKDTKKIKVTAEPLTESATVTGTGEVSMSKDSNKIDVIVTAENGDVRTYTININLDDKTVATSEQNNQKNSNTLLYLIIGGALFVILVSTLVIVFVRKRSKK